MAFLIMLHVLGAVLFLGNIVTAAFWKIAAERAGDVGHLSRTARNVMLADYAFTLPGIVLLLATGVVMAVRVGYAMDAWNWMTASIGLFALSGLVWLAILIPAQRSMMKESAAAARAQAALSPQYRRASRRWDVFGTLVILMPLAVLYLMLNKPF
ncbi:DUF2269 family protein [Cohnella nanjingensis]|uniref:DUF2269 domain-containing protein n=1 Tax=Cohnella nanjingensis TaxID=1387779 RepID=A0A7X0VD88_9BACL|nr:DUF2269 family protein [Cohnella nanjingensis]MBB6669727.1 DUF2269 domain-containing protein [Cohnella nanjingensis]